ncbi:hypothetical protein [Streptomyces sp. NBC_00199]|nr:hypothetical protein [Streptomyces sp. NBC_00199]MCX5263568.1 hypothetical protein [Streptomyces sp. NBC_00199]
MIEERGVGGEGHDPREDDRADGLEGRVDGVPIKLHSRARPSSRRG